MALCAFTLSLFVSKSDPENLYKSVNNQIEESHPTNPEDGLGG